MRVITKVKHKNGTYDVTLHLHHENYKVKMAINDVGVAHLAHARQYLHKHADRFIIEANKLKESNDE